MELLFAAADKKLTLLSLTLEKPEHPQGRDSSVCTIVLYFTIAKSLLINIHILHWKGKKNLSLANVFLPCLHHPLSSTGFQKKIFTGPSQDIISFIKLIHSGMVVDTEPRSHGRVHIFCHCSL